jgi:glycosyltransferase involved in cell wall biosynthesis
MRVGLCIRGVTDQTVRRAEFYRQDIEILRSSGHEVDIVTNLSGAVSGFDLLVVWWWNYLWMWGPVARLCGIPAIVTGVYDLQAFPSLSKGKRLLKRWGTRFGNLHIFINQEEFEKVPTETHILPERARYSPLVVDANVYKPAGPRSLLPFTILNVCWQRMTNLRRKMVFELLEAFAQFSVEEREARLVLAGPPEDGGTVLKRRCQELGIEARVEFPGEISLEHKVLLLQNCSLYVQVSKYEGFGLATAEALACGAPVLVSRVGAVPEVIGDCGSYVSSLDVEGILNGIRSVHADYQGALKKAEQGVERVQRLFSVDRRREDLRRFIDEVMSERRG